MKKVLFLMFLLLLIGLGAASVKAQVRIGGNTPPSAAAVLDLNATDAANLATGGLVLPRVNLTSNTMQLTTGSANLTGTMVYNTTATLGAIGVYFWNGNNWVMSSFPAPQPTDSGAVLMWNGTRWVYTIHLLATTGTLLPTVSMKPTPPTVTWSKIVDTTVVIPSAPVGGSFNVPITGLRFSDLCASSVTNGYALTKSYNGGTSIMFMYRTSPSGTYSLACYRPSL